MSTVIYGVAGVADIHASNRRPILAAAKIVTHHPSVSAVNYLQAKLVAIHGTETKHGACLGRAAGTVTPADDHVLAKART